MTTAVRAPTGTGRARISVVDARPRRRLFGLPAGLVALVAMIAVAVGLQAQQVSGQALLEQVRVEMRDEGHRQAELRAEVAELESPAQVIAAAVDLDMIEPAASVAVPAPPPQEVSETDAAARR